MKPGRAHWAVYCPNKLKTPGRRHRQVRQRVDFRRRLGEGCEFCRRRHMKLGVDSVSVQGEAWDCRRDRTQNAGRVDRKKVYGQFAVQGDVATAPESCARPRIGVLVQHKSPSSDSLGHSNEIDLRHVITGREALCYVTKIRTKQIKATNARNAAAASAILRWASATWALSSSDFTRPCISPWRLCSILSARSTLLLPISVSWRLFW